MKRIETVSLTVLFALALAGARLADGQIQAAGIALDGVTETLFFRTVGPELRGVLLVTVTNTGGATVSGSVAVTAGGDTVHTPVTLDPGSHDVEAHIARIWPGSPDPLASVTLTYGVGGSGSATLGPLTLGIHRPWTLHLAMDKHLDYMWQDPTEQQTRDRMEALTDTYLAAIEADKQGALAAHEQTHFSFDQAIWWDVFKKERPQQEARLAAAEDSDHLGVGALYTVLLGGCLGTEDLVRALYPARAIQREHGTDVLFATPMEIASIPWGLATVLARSGCPYVVKGICGCAGQVSGGHQLGPGALFRWAGPDGSSVLLRWDSFSGDSQFFGGYAELYRMWADGNGLGGITPAQQQDILATIDRFEGYGDDYPVDQILLYGLGWDFWDVGPDRLNDMIRAWNDDLSQMGYDYPRLENSRADQFFAAAEASLAAHGTSLQTITGCFGADWEVWLLYHMWAWQKARAARERLISAETWTAVASLLDDSELATWQATIAAAYRDLALLAEHTASSTQSFGSGLDAGPLGQLKKDLAVRIEDAAEQVSGGALAAIAARIPTGGGPGETVAVFNSTQYPGDAVVEVDVEGAGPYRVIDSRNDRPVDSQLVDAPAGSRLRFRATDLPAVGYRTFRLEPGDGIQIAGPLLVDAASGRLENAFYRIGISPQSGAITSIIDKARGGRQLVQSGGGATGVNAFRAKGSYPTSASIELVEAGPLSATLQVTSTAAGRGCVTRITLHAGVDRIDIDNRVTRPAVSDPNDEVRFDFPFDLTDVQHRYEAGAAITRPGLASQSPPGDHLPGSTMGYFAVQRWVDSHGRDSKGQDGGVRVVTPDAYMVFFGDAPSWNQPQVDSPRVHFIGYDHTPPNGNLGWLGDQSDETGFRFRFAIQGYAGPFQGTESARFAVTRIRTPDVIRLPAWQKGSLPADALAFVEFEGPALLSTLKVAEEGLSRGYVARLWDTSTRGGPVELDLGRFEAGFVQTTDLLERDQDAPAAIQGVASSTVPAHGFRTVRLLPGIANSRPVAQAGRHRIVAAFDRVLLDGRGSHDADDTPTYRWVQLSGRPVQLSAPNAALTEFIAPPPSDADRGVLLFQLVVDDGKHLPATDLVGVMVSAVADDTPPGRPTGLVSAAHGTTIRLGWVAPIDPQSGLREHRIYRAEAAGPYTLRAQVGGDVEAWADTSLPPGKLYRYQVTAVNRVGLEGPPSHPASTRTGGPTFSPGR